MSPHTNGPGAIVHLTDQTDDATEAPWWVRAIYKYGVPAGLAMFFAWWITQSLTADMKTLAIDGAATRQILLEHASEQRYLLRGICLNTARDADQRANCAPMEGR